MVAPPGGDEQLPNQSIVDRAVGLDADATQRVLDRRHRRDVSRQSGRVAIRRSQQYAGVYGALLEGTEPLPIVESVPLRLLDHLHHDRPCTVELAGFAADPDLVSECPNVVVGV